MAKEFTGRRAMGAIGSPVVLITSAHEGQSGIMTINMIAGLSFSPPLVGISLSHHSHTRSLIEKSGEFAINIISPEYTALAKRIGHSTGNKVDKFKEYDIEVYAGEATASPLVKVAHTAIECRVDNTLDLGHHSLYVARALAYHGRDDAGPLYLYHGKYYAIGQITDSFK